MVAVALLSVAVPLALTNCGNSNAIIPTDGGGVGNSSSGSSGASSSGSSGGGGEGDAGTGNSSSGGGGEGGTGSSGVGVGGEGGAGGSEGGASSGGVTPVTCQAPEGGAACDPGLVPCGSTMCDTSQTSCCRATGDAGTDTCVGPNGACTGTLVRCKETGDCQDGLVCCDAYGETSCAASCGAYSFQVCRSDTECGVHADAGAAKKCILQTCGGAAAGGGPPSPVVTLEACAVQSYGGMGMPATWGPVYGCTAK